MEQQSTNDHFSKESCGASQLSLIWHLYLHIVCVSEDKLQLYFIFFLFTLLFNCCYLF